jgi:hypothetical protein
LFHRAEIAAEVDEPAPQQCLDHHAASGHDNAEPQRTGGEESIGAEQAQELPSRSTRGLFQGRGEIRGERVGGAREAGRVRCDLDG